MGNVEKFMCPDCGGANKVVWVDGQPTMRKIACICCAWTESVPTEYEQLEDGTQGAPISWKIVERGMRFIVTRGQGVPVQE